LIIWCRLGTTPESVGTAFIVAQTGISGSCELGDFVVLGGQVGHFGFTRISAMGARFAARGAATPGVYPGRSGLWRRAGAVHEAMASRGRGGRTTRQARQGRFEMDSMTAARDITLDVDQIKRLLPHRAPFLFVERLRRSTSRKRPVGYKAVSYKRTIFPGSFSGICGDAGRAHRGSHGLRPPAPCRALPWSYPRQTHGLIS